MFYNVREAAEYLGVSTKTVYRMVARGDFPAPAKASKSRDGVRKYRYWTQEDLDKAKLTVAIFQRYKHVSTKIESTDS